MATRKKPQDPDAASPATEPYINQVFARGHAGTKADPTPRPDIVIALHYGKQAARLYRLCVLLDEAQDGWADDARRGPALDAARHEWRLAFLDCDTAPHGWHPKAPSGPAEARLWIADFAVELARRTRGGVTLPVAGATTLCPKRLGSTECSVLIELLEHGPQTARKLATSGRLDVGEDAVIKAVQRTLKPGGLVQTAQGRKGGIALTDAGRERAQSLNMDK